MLTISDLPTVNACLNGFSALLLAAGFGFVKRRKLEAHRACMVGALVSSTLFLISYLTYHHFAGATRFQGQGVVRYVYFSILLTHTILAVVIVPMVLMTTWRAFRGQFERHKQIARWTWPIWMYVSVTGVLIYFFLYHWFPSR